ncbi:MAG: excinuclease ABC subunit C, partial [Nanoarchaeota archaeon]|nr:excinuclease ABC subunit C [Nanoarchaeota archaeon]
MNAPFPLDKIPLEPGVYLYRDLAGDIIYIGKAKSLRKRVSSYFSKDHEDIKTAQLVEHIRTVDTIITPNEMEALLLESQLIKKHKPKYNIDLKYGVRYAWIVLTNEAFPRLLTVRVPGIDGEYFGPFVDGTARRQLIDILQKKFFIRTCRTLPKKACLRFHIGICKAPCIKEQTREEYQEQVEQVRKYLRGQNRELIKELESEMKQFSTDLKFELAQQRKDQINALETVQERIVVENSRDNEEDVIDYKRIIQDGDDVVKVIVLSFRRGVLVGKEEFGISPEEYFLDEFIKRYYEVALVPKNIIIPHE